MKTFHLPDLGEGLPDAEIVEWHVAEGDQVEADQPMVSMETAKAVVDVPAPFSGIIAKLYGDAGDVIETGAPLVDFREVGETPSEGQTQQEERPESLEHEKAVEHVAATEDTGTRESKPAAQTDSSPTNERSDSGTVVGAMESSDEVLREEVASGDIKVTPAVRATAKKLQVDLHRVQGSGAGGVITLRDVREAAESGTAPLGERAESPASRARVQPQPAPDRSAEATGEPTPVRGSRRHMIRTMAEAHAAVVPTLLTEDANLSAWEGKQDVMSRVIRAVVAASRAEPRLNAWFDAERQTLTMHANVDIGIAIDTPDGLFVAALRNAEKKTAQALREDIGQLKRSVEDRSIAAEDLKDYTFMLSNVGVFAGRYASPVITPPCVAILALGRLRDQVFAEQGRFYAGTLLPLSLTFDHRAVTGGEAARFLRVMLDDLGRAH